MKLLKELKFFLCVQENKKFELIKLLLFGMIMA